VPLNITIAINGRPLQDITIGRLEKFKGANYWHNYRIISGEETAEFMHLYSRGAEECLRRGLEALSNKRERGEGSLRR
jgi:hypothetical protein